MEFSEEAQHRLLSSDWKISDSRVWGGGNPETQEFKGFQGLRQLDGVLPGAWSVFKEKLLKNDTFMVLDDFSLFCFASSGVNLKGGLLVYYSIIRR